MDNNEAREILIGFNSWRRGEDEDVIYTPQFSPKLIGQAIDFAIQALGDGWVSVEECMLKDRTQYWVFDGEIVFMGYYDGYFEGEPEWHDIFGNDISQAPTHCIEIKIPSPPKPKQP